MRKFAEINKIKNKFDKTTKMAGKDWVYEFIKRHPDLALDMLQLFKLKQDGR